jgi:hypothetical protein
VILDIEAIQKSWTENTLYIPGSSLDGLGSVCPEYYLIEKSQGDMLLVCAHIAQYVSEMNDAELEDEGGDCIFCGQRRPLLYGTKWDHLPNCVALAARRLRGME